GRGLYRGQRKRTAGGGAAAGYDREDTRGGAFRNRRNVDLIGPIDTEPDRRVVEQHVIYVREVRPVNPRDNAVRTRFHIDNRGRRRSDHREVRAAGGNSTGSHDGDGTRRDAKGELEHRDLRWRIDVEGKRIDRHAVERDGTRADEVRAGD